MNIDRRAECVVMGNIVKGGDGGAEKTTALESGRVWGKGRGNGQ